MRHRVTQSLDTPASFIGDNGFVGVNARLEPHALPPGYVSDAVNCRFRNGVVETRKGYMKLPWLNKASTTTVTISSITRASTTATVTTASNHGLVTGSIAQISGATETEYNGSFIATATGATTFTYTVSGAPATPATGTPVLKKLNQQPWGTVYGVGLFSDPATGADYMLIAADGSVYASMDNREPFSISLPAGTTITTNVTFTQAFDTVVMFRGADDAPLAMSDITVGFEAISETPTTITRSGTTATVTTPQDHGFSSGESVVITGATQTEYNGSQTVTVTGARTFTYTVSGSPATPATGDIRVNSDGTEPIPNAERGLFLNNRLVIPNDRDEVAVSDFNSYTKYLPVVSELRVNTGSSDALVALSKFNDTTVIAFKGHSIYAITNFYADLAALQLDQITDKFGLVAADSAVHCGSDLLFLSQMGVMSIRQTEQNKLQGVTVPLSDPIQPLIDRINWQYAAGAKGAYWNNRYYLAVPLDDAEILGPELCPVGLTPLELLFAIPVESGETYRFQMSANDASLANGADNYTTSRDFVATSNYVTLSISGLGTAIGASVKKVTKGVCNAILVYDFLNQAWSGYDEADGFSVRNLHVRKYRGLDRLFVVTNEGWIVLYEEDFQDQLMVPYVDVTVSALPSNGNVVRINTGTTITVNASTTNTATTWGHGSALATAKQNLWVDTDNLAGYSLRANDVWTATDTHVHQINGGIRVFASNGIPPTVFTTGSWATISGHTTQEINSRVTTRGYMPDGGESLSDYDWLCLDVQTWHPDYSLELITNGPFEVSTVKSSITKSRTRYTIWGRADYDPTNANLDHETDHREDYSVDVAAAGGVFLLSGSSVNVGRHQEFREQFKVRKRGRSAQARINCTQGRFRLMALKMENRKTQTKAGART